MTTFQGSLHCQLSSAVPCRPPVNLRRWILRNTAWSTRRDLVIRENTTDSTIDIAECIAQALDMSWGRMLAVKDILLLFGEFDLRIDFLSVYETIETKVKKRQWIGRSRRVMVGHRGSQVPISKLISYPPLFFSMFVIWC